MSNLSASAFKAINFSLVAKLDVLASATSFNSLLVASFI